MPRATTETRAKSEEEHSHCYLDSREFDKESGFAVTSVTRAFFDYFELLYIIFHICIVLRGSNQDWSSVVLGTVHTHCERQALPQRAYVSTDKRWERKHRGEITCPESHSRSMAE